MAGPGAPKAITQTEAIYRRYAIVDSSVLQEVAMRLETANPPNRTDFLGKVAAGEAAGEVPTP